MTDSANFGFEKNDWNLVACVLDVLGNLVAIDTFRSYQHSSGDVGEETKQIDRLLSRVRRKNIELAAFKDQLADGESLAWLWFGDEKGRSWHEDVLASDSLGMSSLAVDTLFQTNSL